MINKLKSSIHPSFQICISALLLFLLTSVCAIAATPTIKPSPTPVITSTPTPIPTATPLQVITVTIVDGTITSPWGTLDKPQTPSCSVCTVNFVITKKDYTPLVYSVKWLDAKTNAVLSTSSNISYDNNKTIQTYSTKITGTTLAYPIIEVIGSNPISNNFIKLFLGDFNNVIAINQTPILTPVTPTTNQTIPYKSPIEVNWTYTDPEKDKQVKFNASLYKYDANGSRVNIKTDTIQGYGTNWKPGVIAEDGTIYIEIISFDSNENYGVLSFPIIIDKKPSILGEVTHTTKGNKVLNDFNIYSKEILNNPTGHSVWELKTFKNFRGSNEFFIGEDVILNFTTSSITKGSLTITMNSKNLTPIATSNGYTVTIKTNDLKAGPTKISIKANSPFGKISSDVYFYLSQDYKTFNK